MIKFSIFKRWVFWLAIFIPLVVILGIVWGLVGSNSFPAAFPNALVAWGTLMLAIATFMFVLSNIEHGNRNRKELLLDRIREWAENIRIVGLERDIEPLRVGAGGSGHSVLSQMINTFRMLRRKGQYISGITLTTWSTLHTFVENMRSELRVQIEALSKYDEHVSQTNFETVQKHRDVVNKIADNIIDEVSRIQTIDLD